MGSGTLASNELPTTKIIRHSKGQMFLLVSYLFDAVNCTLSLMQVSLSSPNACPFEMKAYAKRCDAESLYSPQYITASLCFASYLIWQSTFLSIIFHDLPWLLAIPYQRLAPLGVFLAIPYRRLARLGAYLGTRNHRPMRECGTHVPLETTPVEPKMLGSSCKKNLVCYCTRDISPVSFSSRSRTLCPGGWIRSPSSLPKYDVFISILACTNKPW